MNRMKKWIVCVIALCLALSLFGCGNPDVAKEYADAVAKTNALNSFDVTMNMEIQIKSGSDEMTMPIEARIQTILKGGKISEMLMDLTASMMGQEIEADAYYKDGMLYTSSMGMKMKQEISLEELQEEVPSVNVPEFEADLLAGAQRTEKNGEIEVSVKFDGSKAQEILMEMMEESFSSLDMDSLTDVEMSEVNFCYNINKDGYLSGYELGFGFSAKDGEAVGTIDATMELRFKDPGKPVKITAPNLDEYQDMTGEVE